VALQVQIGGQQPLIGEVPERILQGKGLVVRRHTHAEDGILSPFVRAVEPATFLASEDVDIDEPAQGGSSLGGDAACATARTGARRLGDRCVAFVDAAAKADLLVERPAPHLHAGVAERRKDAAREFGLSICTR